MTAPVLKATPHKAPQTEASCCATLRANGTAPASGYPRATALLRRCAPPSKMRTGFRTCASWKIPTISSKVRTFFQGAHVKLSTFAEPRATVVRSLVGARFIGCLLSTEKLLMIPLVRDCFGSFGRSCSQPPSPRLTEMAGLDRFDSIAWHCSGARTRIAGFASSSISSVRLGKSFNGR